MANKRMFSSKVVETDSFYSLTSDAQSLYFHLSMNGDDDGFVASPRFIVRGLGLSGAALTELENNGFIYQYDCGCVVVRDWKINNTLKNDRYKPTSFKKEFAELETDENGKYSRIDEQI